MYMNTIVEVVLVGCLVFVLLANSSMLANFSNSVLGKFILIALVVLAALHNKVSGLIAVLIFVSISNTYQEGFESKENASKESEEGPEVEDIPDSDVAPSSDEMDFRSKHCKKGVLVDKNGKEVGEEEVAVLYPNLNLDSDKCNNPCDENCGFSISTTSDQIGIETQIRPQSSNKIPVNPNQSSEHAQPTATSSSKEGFFSL